MLESTGQYGTLPISYRLKRGWLQAELVSHHVGVVAILLGSCRMGSTGSIKAQERGFDLLGGWIDI
jgi:hypothetical protein